MWCKHFWVFEKKNCDFICVCICVPGNMMAAWIRFDALVWGASSTPKFLILFMWTFSTSNPKVDNLIYKDIWLALPACLQIHKYSLNWYIRRNASYYRKWHIVALFRIKAVMYWHLFRFSNKIDSIFVLNAIKYTLFISFFSSKLINIAIEEKIWQKNDFQSWSVFAI